MGYLKQLQELYDIYYGIKLAKSKIRHRESLQSAFPPYKADDLEIITDELKRLQERQSKITIQLYKRNVTKTQ